MFRCDGCRNVTKPGESMTKVVVEARQKDYFGERDGRRAYEGSGVEIVREIQIGPCCKERP